MIEREHHKNKFTAEDIERYHAGKMSAQEMHLLEKFALDDPFLADALEGYSFTQTPASDVQFLKEELKSKLGSNKVVVLPKEKSTNQLWKVAALFILIAGLGWTVYQFSFKSNTKEIAITTPTVNEEKRDTTNYPVANKQADNAAELADTEAKTSVATKTAKKVSKKSEEIIDHKEEQFINRNNRFGYTPADNNVALNVPLSKEKIADPKENLETEAAAVDSGSLAAKSFSEAPQARQQQENIIVLQRAKDSSMEEVVLGKGRRDSNYRKPKITFEEAEPKDGQLFYDDYIAQNIKLPETEKFKNTSREVQLSFDITETGQAVNIQVEKPLCEECDKEAIRLLKDGPKLVKKRKNKKGKLSIRF